ncbi:Pyruvate phosphate dikinase, PEP/pyruvate-binding domain protein (fragment) [Candidatus Desulfarcum epimagneticum]|uniref:Pyruvate phosphate dikinase, PEP/pyruvate-binding domain protein n=1 Tax=uncultured Desulfobacteraceae bacterium TaxID=218296 RepID=A0A484HHU1_9BACT
MGNIFTKRKMTIPAMDGSGTIDARVPRVMAEHLSMTDQQAVKTAELALKLEKESGFAVDIECGWKGEKLFLFQCRPVAT